MTPVEAFIYSYDDSQREIMLYAHKLLSENLGLLDKIRFKIPFYYQNSWVCYLNPLKEGGIEFAFIRGNELSNSQGLLESKGRKQVMGLTIRALSELPEMELIETLQEALLLDETVSYASKRKNPKSAINRTI